MNIVNYDSIQIGERSLVALDIDHTIMKFNAIHKTWWEEKKLGYEQVYSKELSDKLALQEWMQIIKSEPAELIDVESFTNLLHRIHDTESSLIFITARHESLKEHTMRHIAECNLHVSSDDVYHVYPKGKHLLDIYNKKYKHLQNIIFVDDDMNNIKDVQTNVSHLKLSCYYLQHEKLLM